MDTTPITLQRYNNGPFAWHQTGDGDPLVFVHGVGLRAESWLAQIQHFGQTHRVYALDLPGHGFSERIETDSPELADYATGLSRFLRTEVSEPVVLIGHSMGAMLALDVATRHPDVCKGVAALNAIYRRAPSATLAVQTRATQLEDKIESILVSATVQRWFGDAPKAPLKDLAELCRQWLTQADRKGYADAYRVFANEDGPTTLALQHLNMPALFLTGAMDQNSTPEMTTTMAKLTQRGKAHVLSGAGHMAPMTHPKEVNQSLRELIDRCHCNAEPDQEIGCVR